MTATTSYHASAEPPRQPIPGANWPRRGTALGGQPRQPASRKEADPPSESIQSAGAEGKPQQYGSSGEAGWSGSVVNAGSRGEKAGVSAGLEEAPWWSFCFKKTLHAPNTCGPQAGVNSEEPEARYTGVFTSNSRDT